jgi:hypothetical protein
MEVEAAIATASKLAHHEEESHSRDSSFIF